MSAPCSPCTSDAPRRTAVRGANLNGLDEVEVDLAEAVLRVTFLGHAPEWLEPANVTVTGGPDQRAITVRDIRIDRSDDEGLDDVMTVWLDRPAGPGDYTLAIRALDQRGEPRRVPEDFDSRYAQVRFAFTADCPSDIDCADARHCPPPAFAVPNIDYLARDYAGFRRLMLDRMALTLPESTERHAADLGITLVEAIATVADQLSYYQDAVATEAYLGTARRRISVRRHARLVDYALHEGTAAQGWATFEIAGDITLAPDQAFFVTPVIGIENGAVAVETYQAQAPVAQIAYEPVLAEPLVLREVRNRIALHRWRETGCCLPKGATGATLVDPGPQVPPEEPDTAEPATARRITSKAKGPPDTPPQTHGLDLAPGQVLVLAEVRGPRTGRPEDADPTRRHAVRLTRATRATDPLDGTPLWEVAWCAQDALPFALCLDSVTEAPDCQWIEAVSVAYGNVALVGAGLRRKAKWPAVPSDGVDRVCGTACDPAEDRELAGPFRPALPAPDLTWRVPVPHWTGDCRQGAANRLLRDGPEHGIPLVTLTSTLANRADQTWTAVGDLLGSGPADAHFVVEVDNDGTAWLRFGDGACGLAPAAGEQFAATYRTGNGPDTNLGSDALGLVVFREGFRDGLAIKVGNPLPLRGGVAPETLQHARLAAPSRYRARLERAIVPADYAAIIERDFAGEVQRAAAVMRRSGAAHEVQIAIDPIGGGTADLGLLRAVERHLRDYRRIGHDLRAVPAREVALAISLLVCVDPLHRRELVTAALRRALGPQGLFAPDNWTFGDAIAASRIVATAQRVEGVAHVTLRHLGRRFVAGDGEMESLEVLRLGAQNLPVLEPASLQLEVRGGR
ncbi:putative baseplate assembly protein [Novosphingobium sp. 9U]|uniref:putative baseplate assembly protein n=1 Tax=Novosphingobium sp. 9U TaxID=2653158 RepID=UPI0012F2AB87|nr:putative baseplate assembly protein [Novosphingobium sp. 9U]VWX50894.1 Putative baseplate assembly protein [Novosphingobium sp. 9U]